MASSAQVNKLAKSLESEHPDKSWKERQEIAREMLAESEEQSASADGNPITKLKSAQKEANELSTSGASSMAERAFMTRVKERQDRAPKIYQLVNGSKRPTAIFKAEEVIQYRDESGRLSRRKIKYVNGESSIFPEEQSALDLKPTPVVFNGGFCTVSASNRQLQEFMTLSNHNSENEFSETSDNSWVLQDGEREAKKSQDKEMLEFRAMEKLAKMPLDKIIMLAKVYGLSSLEGPETAKYHVLVNAKKDPKGFLLLLDDESIERKANYETAKDHGIVRISGQTVAWGNGGDITYIPVGVKESDFMNDFFTTPEGKPVYNMMMKKLEAMFAV